jgi:hypothetical protein
LNFIIRCVLILLAFAFIVYVFKSIARLSHRLRGTIKDFKNLREEVSGRAAVASTEMVRCAACGAFVMSRDAVSVSSRKSARTFCSPECMRSSVLK